jgi:predicted RNA polymerase sigma factor
MAQRISRAKQKVKSSGSSFSLPDKDEWPARLASVLHVLYLMFNEGYAASSGAQLQRRDLAAEAIRLTRMLLTAAPDEPEVIGLLALMLLTDARRIARTGPSGELIPLDEQDRRTWDRNVIEEGRALVAKALPMGRVGPYQLQAAIAALHDEADSTDTTDWPQILALYRVLGRITDNPMVALNEAIAVAMVDGPAAGLARLDVLAADNRIASSHRLAAVRAHLLERSGELAAAQAAYREAAGRTASVPERNYLLTKAARLSSHRDG